MAESTEDVTYYTVGSENQLKTTLRFGGIDTEVTLSGFATVDYIAQSPVHLQFLSGSNLDHKARSYSGYNRP